MTDQPNNDARSGPDERDFVLVCTDIGHTSTWVCLDDDGRPFDAATADQVRDELLASDRALETVTITEWYRFEPT